MAWNETPVTVVGLVITDVTHRHTADGVSVANFRVSSTERKYNREQQEWVDGERLFVGVTCWRRLADNARTTLSKGDPVVVNGKLRVRSYEAEGERRQSCEVEATAIGLDLSRCNALQVVPEIIAPRAGDDLVPVGASTAGAEEKSPPF